MSKPPSNSINSAKPFSGRVVLITGGGGSLGGSYAKLFARLGAAVFVNDLVPAGVEESNSPAQLVVNDILSSGGLASANFSSVTAGPAIVAACVAKFGRLDVLINNAGMLRDKSFSKLSQEDWDSINEIHVRAAFQLTKAAWEIFRQQKFGRIIMTSSASGLYGNFGQSNYAAAKLALVGFSQSLAKEGAKLNIFCNAIAPVAGSQLTATVMTADMVAQLKPEFVAPVVAFLCHESSTVNGEIFELGGGWVSRVRWQRSKGARFPLNADYLNGISSVSSLWSVVEDFSSPDYPNSGADAFKAIMENINKNNTQAAPEQKSSPPVGESSFKSAAFFSSVSDFLATENGAALARKLPAVFLFSLTKGEKKQTFAIDFKAAPPRVLAGEDASALKSDVSFVVSDSDFASLLARGVSAQSLFMSGKLKVKGNLQLGMKLQEIIKALPKAKL